MRPLFGAAACALTAALVALVFGAAGLPVRTSTPTAPANLVAAHTTASMAIASHALAAAPAFGLTSNDRDAGRRSSSPLDEVLFDDDDDNDDDDELARHDIDGARVQLVSDPLRSSRTSTEPLSPDARTRANQFLLETVRRL